MKLIKSLITSSILLLIVSLGAIDDNAGTNGFNFLKINYSAKAAALGGAYTAMSGEVDAFHYNPAALKEVNKRYISTSYISYFDGYNGGSVIYNRPGENQSFALYGEYINSGEIDKYNSDGINEGTFSASDILVGATFSRVIHSMLTIGVNAKYLMETIDDNSATAVAIDLGIVHQPVNERMKIGLAIRNLGYQIIHFSDSEHDEKFPITYAAGLRYKFSDKVYANLEVDKAYGQDVGSAIGVDASVHPMFAVRGGYKLDATDWRTGSKTDFLAGTSFGFGFFWQKFVLDYAISGYGDLGYINQVSLKYSF